MTTEAESVAKGLTKAQREAVKQASHVRFEDGYVLNDHYDGTGVRVSLPTIRRLERVGVVTPAFWPPRLTDLGLAVRAHLEQQQ
jgi:hypothetical protein